jgi:tRNA A37 threonylcarbamoyltransferase TsaD
MEVSLGGAAPLSRRSPRERGPNRCEGLARLAVVGGVAANQRLGQDVQEA